MPVTHRQRATVVTPVTTFKAHELQIDEANRIAAVFDRMTWEPVAILTDAEWTAGDRGGWSRVAGLDGNGDPQVWKSIAVTCGRCATQAVFATPAWDLPT